MTSMTGNTLASTGKFGSAAPLSSTGKSSVNTISRSRLTGEVSKIFSLCRLTSSSARRFPRKRKPANQGFPTSSVHPVRKEEHPEKTKESRKTHASAKTRPCVKSCRRRYSASQQHQWDQSRRNISVPQRRTFFQLIGFLAQNILMSTIPHRLISFCVGC